MREEFRADNAAMREEFSADNAAMREEFTAELRLLREDQAAMKARLELIEQRLERLEQRMDDVEARMSKLEARHEDLAENYLKISLQLSWIMGFLERAAERARAGERSPLVAPDLSPPNKLDVP